MGRWRTRKNTMEEQEYAEEDEKQFLQNMLNNTVLKIAICKPDGSQCARVSNATGLEVDNSK